ncbi:MAG: hypothetical protein Q9219_000791 [cf. Caloplaca sp. 3 TL-2023]
MPSLSDKTSRPAQQTSSFPLRSQEVPVPQEERSRGHKLKKKHDRITEVSQKGRTTDSFPKDLSSAPLLDASNDVSSPLLAALGTYPATENISQLAFPGREWTDDISSHGSPPNDQSNGFTPAGSPQNARPLARGLAGGFSGVSPSSSPPNTYTRPISHRSGYQSLGGYLSSSPTGERPSSMQSHRSSSQKPALPHYPQAHFYSAPEVDLGLPQTRQSSQSAPLPHCCFFDSLGAAGAEGFQGQEGVLLVGLENRLDVLNIEQGRLGLVGRLANLRGAVVGAKLLPLRARGDLARSLCPLVAVVLHGPHYDQHPTSRHTPSQQQGDAVFDPSASMLQVLESAEDVTSDSGVRYQTTVEVYSLGKSEHIATLLSTPLTDAAPSQHVSHPDSFPVSGDWRIQACGRFLAIASERSGEVFLFESVYGVGIGSKLTFKNIGKTWTSVIKKKPRSLSTSSTESDIPEIEHGLGRKSSQRDGALFSLSHRWLAIVPPRTATKTTVHASVDLLHSYHKPPGLSSHTSPSSPQPTCDIDTPERESLLNKVARDVTQELMKGARWVGDQGIQAWKNYWQKPAGPSHQGVAKSLPSDTVLAPHLQNSLPPTHAHDDGNSRSIDQHAVVSILDLEKLSNNQSTKEDIALQPVATFAPPDGCSLVSFTPNGLGLLTASTKGDVQHLWSLMRMALVGAVPRTDTSHIERGPSVRQIARFTRMTVARIIDVVWTEPGGERLALVTERGTVHIFDLPTSALQWPPPRRVMKTAFAATSSSRASPELEAAVVHSPPLSRFGSAMEIVTGRTQPLLAAARGRPASIGNPFSSFSGISLTAGAGIKSGKVVAAGFNKSVGAATETVNTIRHIGENRLALPGPAYAAVSGHVHWLTGKTRGSLIVTGGDLVRIYRTAKSSNQTPRKRRPSVVVSKPVELNLAVALSKPTKDELGQSQMDRLRAGKSQMVVHGFWQAPPPRPIERIDEDSVHSQAEIDTNAPYQPFHTDRRVNTYAYTDDITALQGLDFGKEIPWVFGQAIPAIRTSAGAATSDDADDPDLQQQGRMENHVSVQVNEKEEQQIVITTRRRKLPKADAGEGGEAEIFEGDCEVVDFADERV